MPILIMAPIKSVETFQLGKIVWQVQKCMSHFVFRKLEKT